MCGQDSYTSIDFSWRNMQTGSRNPPKPEVVITVWREVISAWFQRLWHNFRARPIHFHLRRHRPTMENTIRYKPEVKTVPQTGSTNNIRNGNRYRHNLSGYTYVFGSKSFTGVYANLIRRNSFIQKFQDGGRILEVIITLRRKTISRWS